MVSGSFEDFGLLGSCWDFPFVGFTVTVKGISKNMFLLSFLGDHGILLSG